MWFATATRQLWRRSLVRWHFRPPSIRIVVVVRAHTASCSTSSLPPPPLAPPLLPSRPPRSQSRGSRAPRAASPVPVPPIERTPNGTSARPAMHSSLCLFSLLHWHVVVGLTCGSDLHLQFCRGEESRFLYDVRREVGVLRCTSLSSSSPHLSDFFDLSLVEVRWLPNGCTSGSSQVKG